MSLLFSPLQLRALTLKNRIVVSPMCQYSSKDGFADNWHLIHLDSRAIGGAAVVFTEATAVSPEGRISLGDLGLWKDDHIEFLKNITASIISAGSLPGIQLAHAGRKASTKAPWEGGQPLTAEEGAWQTSSASNIAFKTGHPEPVELDSIGIKKIINHFRDAAKRAHTAGFSIIEVHAAHGYLVNQFLSPLSNKRADEYGGSFENRIRLLIEIINAIRSVWPLELPLFVRISASEYAEGGWTAEDSVHLARILLTAGVDLIDCSSGGNTAGVKIPVGPGYQVPFAEKIKKETGMPTAAVGMITSATQAEEILSSGKADLIMMARQLLRDPYFALHAAKELGDSVTWPVQYERAI